MLSDRKRELEEQLSTIMEENDQLQGIVEELHDRELALNQESCAKELQVQTFVNKCILLDEQKNDFSESL